MALPIPVSLNSQLFGIQTFYCVRNRVPYLNTKLSNKITELYVKVDRFLDKLEFSRENRHLRPYSTEPVNCNSLLHP